VQTSGKTKWGEILEKTKGIRLYWKLFLSTFVLSAFTFGGGYVIVPLMRKKFVEQYKWIEEEEMLDLVAISQSCPGAIAVNASVLIGYRVGGVAGALATVLGTSLPPLIILSVISYFYQAFRSNLYVGYALKGMQAGVAAVIIDVVYTMAADVVKKKKWLPIVIMVLSFIFAYFFDINVILIIALCAVVGLIFGRGQKKA
jgi:chromate transporter